MVDGVPDVEIGGPGTAPDGERIYVDLSSTANALDIGLGVDTKFASSERSLRAGQHITSPFKVTLTDRVVRASGIALVNNQGESIDQNASFEADCS